MNLYINWYEDDNERRRAELLTCLQKNIDHPKITSIYCLTEKLPLEHKKLKKVSIYNRPTYADMLQAAVHDGIKIIANTDIYFDETLEKVYDLITPNTCLALTRYDIINQRGQSKFHAAACSQDVWIFKTIKPVQCSFHMGKPGCDNRFAWELKQAGYKLLNPSKTIKTYHLHLSKKRNWDRRYDKVPPPYHTIQPTL